MDNFFMIIPFDDNAFMTYYCILDMSTMIEIIVAIRQKQDLEINSFTLLGEIVGCKCFGKVHEWTVVITFFHHK